MGMVEGSASVVINRPVAEVFAAITDITRMGEWSPECVSGRWIAPAAGPAVGASFEGDNIAKLGPVTLKKWTTTSEVTACVENEVFEFSAEGYTTWRYDFKAEGESTTVTESFSYPQYEGFQKFLYVTIARRDKGLATAVQATLNRIKAVLEA